MRNILKFSQFLNEALKYPDGVELTKDQLKYIVPKIASQGKFSSFVSDNNFERIYVNPQGFIVIRWAGKDIRIPGLMAGLSSTIPFNALNVDEYVWLKLFSDLRDNGILLLPDYYNNGGIDRDGKNILAIIIDGLVQASRKNSKFLNPFDTNFTDLPVWKSLERMGTKIVSKDIQKKRGTLVLSNDFFDQANVAIFTNGYIRRIASYSDRPAQMTRNPELVRPIYTLEDLIIKLEYIRFHLIKKIILSVGYSQAEANNLIKSIKDKSSGYDDLVKELVNKDPRLVTVLPPPEEGFDKDLEAGAKLLDRFGGLF